MKRFAVLLAVCALLFGGCRGLDGDLDAAMALRERILAGSGCSFTACVTVDYDDSYQVFTLACEADSEGKIAFTVLSPESIRDIGGQISSTGGELTYDDVVLAFPLLAQGEISPVCAPWLVYRAMTNGFIRLTSQEESFTRVTLDDTFHEESLQIDLWLNKQGEPELAELTWEGRRLLTVQIEDFRIL